MLKKSLVFILNCRLENVMAAGVSTLLLLLSAGTNFFHQFHFGMLDFLFILLPVAILGVKCLLELLAAPPRLAGDEADTARFFAQFFQPLLKLFRDWFPFLLLSACYYSLYSNLIMQVNPHPMDAFLSRADAALLGTQVSFLLEPYIHTWLTDFLNLVYFSHVLFFPGVALYFYVKKDTLVFRRIMMGYLTIILMGTASYISFPAAGPEKYFAGQYAINLQGEVVSRSVAYIISVGRVAYDCFPSLHVGIPLLLSFYIRDHRRKWFAPMLAYVAVMCLATLYLRYHYLIDVIAAFAYAPAAYFLNDFLLSRWPGERRTEPRTESRPEDDIPLPDAVDS